MKKAKNLKFLIFGDVFGKLGRKLVKDNLPQLKSQYSPDMVLANAENLTHGSGTSKATIQELMDAGINFFTGGNHTFDNFSVHEVLADPQLPVIRPANWSGVEGDGYKIVEVGEYKVLIVNLIGQLFIKGSYENPFQEIEKILSTVNTDELSAILVDFHAEATSEAAAMGYFLDGKVSAVYGSHSHVQTSDERILPKGTGYITDIGMSGPLNSIIGMKIDGVVEKFRKPEEKIKVEIEETGEGLLNAILIEVDPKTKACKSVKRINIKN